MSEDRANMRMTKESRDKFRSEVRSGSTSASASASFHPTVEHKYQSVFDSGDDDPPRMNETNKQRISRFEQYAKTLLPKGVSPSEFVSETLSKMHTERTESGASMEVDDETIMSKLKEEAVQRSKK